MLRLVNENESIKVNVVLITKNNSSSYILVSISINKSLSELNLHFWLGILGTCMRCLHGRYQNMTFRCHKIKNYLKKK